MFHYIYFYTYIIFIMVISVGNATRRIVDGSTVKSEKRYVVYLLKAENDAQKYDAWLCGGAIVTPYFIVTSAACVLDVEHIYVIAGYERYLITEKIKDDECIKKTKRRVIYTCVPKYYKLDYTKIHKWASIDIALVKVDKPYTEEDKAFKDCTYVPEPILINYETKYQRPGIDAIVLGWGHEKKWRKPDDKHNYNSKHLRYASTMIEHKEICKKHFEPYNMSHIIDNYMICTFESGNLNENGEIITHSSRNASGCSDAIHRADATEFDEDLSQILDTSDQEEIDSIRKENTRKHGICQNDHGGPLVTWVGSHEVLIGVASVFKVNKESKCTGPYLFTSTQCNGAFLSCILDEFGEKLKEKHNAHHNHRYKRELCDSPQLRGYDKYERYISWDDLPDSPAAEMDSNNNDSNIIRMRPQRLLYDHGN